MKNIDVPFNLYVAPVSEKTLAGLRPVTSTYIFEGSTDNLHPDGLYSPSIFGRMGDDVRLFRFSFIDIKIEIIHPLIFDLLTSMKGMYGEIMSGATYAVWNDEKKDFEKSNALSGQTGYHFFFEKFKEIKLSETGSDSRSQMISLVEKYKDASSSRYVIVCPAGMREININADGRTDEHDLNPLYRRLLTLSSSITRSGVEMSPEIYNKTRMSLQNTFNEIWAFFMSMIDGKKKLVMGKFASRKVFNGTRNVASAMNTTCEVLGDDTNIGYHNTMVGLFQYMKATLPLSVYDIKNTILNKVFVNKDYPVRLINKGSLKQEDVDIHPETFDLYSSNAGIEKLIENYRSRDLRHRYVEIEDHYLALIYLSDDGAYKVFFNIDDKPEHIGIDKVRPITMTELLYISVYQSSKDIPIYVTRYPIAGLGSIYPSIAYLTTTTTVDKRYELDDNWEINKDRLAPAFPIIDKPFYDTSSPHPSRNVGLGLDYDGDTISDNAVYTEDAKEEVRKYLQDPKAYVGIDGKIKASIATDTVNLIFYALSRKP